MPAYFSTGFSVREPMWHGEGLVLADYPTDWEDAREKAGLTWEPAIVPCYASIELLTEQDARAAIIGRYDEAVITDERLFFPLQDHRLVERDDTHAILGVVSDQFALVHHSVMGQILEAITGQPNVKFETAGSCRGGADVWALVYIDEPYTVPGDDSATYPFIALLNSHGGTGACKATRTQVRVVCWNTYQAASMEGDRTGLQFTFRHVGDVTNRIEEALAALQGARNEAKEWTDLATELFGLKVTDPMVEDFLVRFLPEPIGEIASPRVHDNVERARKVFRTLYFDSPTCAAHMGTGLGLVDASVEYLDHVRGYRNRDTLMGRTLLRPEPLKAKAVSLVRSLVSA